jgi:hypothetical protein
MVLEISSESGNYTETVDRDSTLLTARVYQEAVLAVTLKTHRKDSLNPFLFRIKMLFSFHAKPEIPETVTVSFTHSIAVGESIFSKSLSSAGLEFHRDAKKEPQDGLHRSLFNCSVHFFPRFRQHLDCNLERECIGGSAACGGQVASQGKCYFLALQLKDTETPLLSDFTWNQAAGSCRQLGGQLASISSPREVSDLRQLWKYARFVPRTVYVGLNLRKYSTVLPIPIFTSGRTRLSSTPCCTWRKNCWPKRPNVGF